MDEMMIAPEEAPLEDPLISEIIGGEVDSWWKIRLALMRRSFRDNWKIFRRNKVGVLGLVIIAFWAIMAVMPTVFFATGFWNPAIYHPVTGLELDPPTRTMIMVERLTDPTTEIDPRAALLDGRIPDTLQVGDTFDLPLQPAPPDGRHWLGTDPLGRDIMSQLMHGARASFFLGILAAVVTVVIGTTIGSMAAYFGGIVDAALMRFADLLIMIPGVALLIVIGGLFTFQLWHLAVVIGVLSGFGGTAIVLKSQALAVKVKPFIDAARVAGGSARHIIFYHLIPNVMPLSVLYMMFTVTGAIQSEAVLSFLGILNTGTSWGLMMNLARTQGYLLQVDAARVAGGSARHIIFYHLIPNVMPLSVLYMMFTVTGAIQSEAVLSFLGILNTDTSWGLMMNLARTQGYLLQVTNYWWLTIPPGLAVTFLSMAFFLVGRGMDEIVNPRLRRR